jgi:hypothetical protein
MTPTQIEAIEALFPGYEQYLEMCAERGVLFVNDGRKVLDAAKAALKAAAGVGDKPQATFPHGTLLVNATIERCAQWLEDHYHTAKMIQIANHMRRDLKDNPYV